MNKKATSMLVKAIIGIILAVLILGPITNGVIKVYNALSSVFISQDNTKTTGNFNDFEEIIDKVIETKEHKNFLLKLNYDDVVFSVDDVNSFKLQKEISYKNPVTNKEIKFKEIKRPEECKEDSNCICKCKLSSLDNNQAQCISDDISCKSLKEHEKIKGDFISIYLAPGSDLPKSELIEDKLFITASLLPDKQILPTRNQYVVPLSIFKENINLKIIYNPSLVL